MADNIINVKLLEAYDTEENWAQKNPVILAGQLAFSSNKYGYYKIGDGAKKWSQLDYHLFDEIKKIKETGVFYKSENVLPAETIDIDSSIKSFVNYDDSQALYPVTVAQAVYLDQDTVITDRLLSTIDKQKLELSQLEWQVSGLSGTDYLRIKINSEASWMLSFIVNIYSGNNQHRIQISGRNDAASKTWGSPTAQLLSSTQLSSVAVTFAKDADNNLSIYLPISGDNGSATISNVVNGGTIVKSPSLFALQSIASENVPTQDVLVVDAIPATASSIGVSFGGTGTKTFASGELLIGDGTNSIKTRKIKDITSRGNLGWTSNTADTLIPTINTLAYWDGRYNSNSSNLIYCSKGAFGDLAIKDSLSKGDVGLGNVDNKSSETIRSEITQGNVTTALGYTPVNKAGDTMSDTLRISKASETGVEVANTGKNHEVRFIVGESGNGGIWDATHTKWVVYSDVNGNAWLNGTADNAGALVNKVLDSTTISNTAGTFSFSGAGAPWEGTDWVGFQVGSTVDKFQITVNNGVLKWRQNDSGGTNSDGWTNWVGAASDSSVVTLSGAQTISGAKTFSTDIFFSNTGTGTRQIRGQVGDNDYWRIAGGATASNAGWMEIATADDGNEPVYVRQYTGVYSSITRTATLLDASGNTSFPGSLTVNGSINSVAGSVYAGNAQQTSERQVGVNSAAGIMYMFSQGSASGSRGIWLPAHGTGAAKAVLTVDTNNNVAFNGNASSATTSTTKAATDNQTNIATTAFVHGLLRYGTAAATTSNCPNGCFYFQY